MSQMYEVEAKLVVLCTQEAESRMPELSQEEVQAVFQGLIGMIFPLLLTWLMDKFETKSTREVSEHVKEAGYFQKLLIKAKCKQIARRKRKSFRVAGKSFRLSKDDAAEAAEICYDSILMGIHDNPGTVDIVVDETKENTPHNWSEFFE